MYCYRVSSLFCSKVALNNYAYMETGVSGVGDMDDRTVLTVRPVSQPTKGWSINMLLHCDACLLMSVHSFLRIYQLVSVFSKNILYDVIWPLLRLWDVTIVTVVTILMFCPLNVDIHRQKYFFISFSVWPVMFLFQKLYLKYFDHRHARYIWDKELGVFKMLRSAQIKCIFFHSS